MGYKLAIDFGTTNSVITIWNEEINTAEIVTLPDLSVNRRSIPPVIPSLVYVHDGQKKQVTIGQAVRDKKLDQQKGNRLFRNFKRGMVASPAPPPRPIDKILWEDKDAAYSFLRHIVESIPYSLDEIEQLVLTSFPDDD
ncbi:hypothetical protein QUF63_01995 [Anaerolineales bacterium HSG25]|nr:hypothetical protein [Anaerolineales bacterium HSG25]